MHSDSITIAVEHQHIHGTLAVPETGIPGILFVHGWSGSQENDLVRAREIAALGCACLTFDLRGHAATENLRPSITPEHNLRDALAAYDTLISKPMVDKSAIAVIGSSYGAYLAAILTSLRPVRWLSLRAPAIYRDAHWTSPKGKLDRLDLTLYRQQRIDSSDNNALDACAKFAGDVLLVESERDDYIPHPTVTNYIGAFRKAHSLTYRVVDAADHALSDGRSRQAYTSLLVQWIREMVLGAR
jgi:uncharacterized protein